MKKGYHDRNAISVIYFTFDAKGLKLSATPFDVRIGSDSAVRFGRALRQLHFDEPTFKALMQSSESGRYTTLMPNPASPIASAVRLAWCPMLT
jgi:hypothetical protein